jgi:hypothetical protein
MKWRMKVGIEWRPSMASRQKIGGRSATPWLPYKRVAKGSLLLHPTSSQTTLNFLNPSPSY